MKRFRLHYKFVCLALWASLAVPVATTAGQPAPSNEAAAEAKKASPPPRAKPQVVYHLSGDAAALHAQAKAQGNALPIDGSMPISLQMARSAANAAAAKEAAAVQSHAPAEPSNEIKPPGEGTRQQAAKKPRSRSMKIPNKSETRKTARGREDNARSSAREKNARKP